MPRPTTPSQLRALIDIAYDRYGLRTQITIFADAQLMPEKSARVEHMRRLLDELADPLFVAAHDDDFRVRPESPAPTLGFQPLSLEAIGPRPIPNEPRMNIDP